MPTFTVYVQATVSIAVEMFAAEPQAAMLEAETLVERKLRVEPHEAIKKVKVDSVQATGADAAF